MDVFMAWYLVKHMEITLIYYYYYYYLAFTGQIKAY
jgi:hypothetical protein